MDTLSYAQIDSGGKSTPEVLMRMVARAECAARYAASSARVAVGSCTVLSVTIFPPPPRYFKRWEG